MKDRKELLNNLSEAQFASWDTHLFLDTHKSNKEAFSELQSYLKKANDAREAYEEEFGPLSPSDIYGETSFEWLSAPWPWERSANK